MCGYVNIFVEYEKIPLRHLCVILNIFICYEQIDHQHLACQSAAHTRKFLFMNKCTHTYIRTNITENINKYELFCSRQKVIANIIPIPIYFLINEENFT